MKDLLVIVNAIIFVLLGLLHFYWASGGKWSLAAAIPAKFREGLFKAEKKTPFVIATLIVAFGLILFALITWTYLSVNVNLLSDYKWYLLGIIAGIFLIRGIGDFSLFGIFRKDGNDIFTKADKRIYTPLCLYLSLTSFYILLG